jgi:hypothetical protein
MNTGLLIRPIEPDHYIHGDGKLGAGPINPSGQWDDYLPPLGQQQNKGGFEPMDCTINALRNSLYVLLKLKNGTVDERSERWLATISGTTESGNDPHTVAEAFRNRGDVLETDWPYSPDITSWDKFYAAVTRGSRIKAAVLGSEYAFGHSWVTDVSSASLIQSLTFSPLSAGVYAWQFDPSVNLYTRPKGVPSEHDVMIYGYEPGKYWKIFDSYNPNLKQLAWDFGFDAVKRYTINRQIVNQTAWQIFLNWFNRIITSIGTP